MNILPLVIAPNPLLYKVSDPVEKIDAKLQTFMDDMLTTMYAEQGIGLAAVQVGVLKRILVMDIDYRAEACDDHGCGHAHNITNQKPRFLINPKIIKASKEKSDYFEGCLSFPEIRADIIRPKQVTVEYLDYHGNKQIMEADGVLATCVQHEIDHLNGITFVDYLSRLKQEIVLKKMKKRQLAIINE